MDNVRKHLSPDELGACVQFEGKKASYIIDITGAGMFEDVVEAQLQSVIENACKTYEGHIGSCGFLYFGRSKTVSFVPLSDGKYLFFNSHCVDNNRVVFVASKGAARLLRCLSVAALLRCVLAEHPRDGKHWHVYGLILT